MLSQRSGARSFCTCGKDSCMEILRMRKQCVLSASPPGDEFSLNCSVYHMDSNPVPNSLKVLAIGFQWPYPVLILL